jgi:hypothetical protein
MICMRRLVAFGLCTYKKRQTDSRHQGNHNAILYSIFVLAASGGFH